MELKEPTTYKWQLDKIRSRGCVIDDEDLCYDALKKLNYYRFTAYFLPFRNPDETYEPGILFSRIYRIYQFDRHLRNLIFAVIEEVEIFLRSTIAYFHAHKYGKLGYENASAFNQKHSPSLLINRQ